MKKYLVGIVIGIALTVSTSAFAADVVSLIGQKIQGEFPVTLDGKALDKPAIVINGTSYLPNRIIADATGYDITFDADLGITLKKKEVNTMSSLSTETIKLGNDIDPLPEYDPEVTYTLEQIEQNIATESRTINSLKFFTEDQGDNPTPRVIKLKGYLKIYQDDLALWEARKAALQ